MTPSLLGRTLRQPDHLSALLDFAGVAASGGHFRFPVPRFHVADLPVASTMSCSTANVLRQLARPEEVSAVLVAYPAGWNCLYS